MSEKNFTNRKSYTIQQKLAAISKYEPNCRGRGFGAVSKQTNIPIPNLKRWYNQKHQLNAMLNDTEISIKISRRVTGGGRKEEFAELEDKMISWVRKRNEKGLRVKDKYIQIKAKSLAEEFCNGTESDQKYEQFKASLGWCGRFKNRFHLVSRRQTSCSVLPKNAESIITTFHQNIFEIIQKNKILPRNIINMDQVPRYFEAEQKSTIATKGKRHIIMRKASSSHKRFTVTFSINMEGKIFKPHFLFPNLKKKPVVSKGCLVDVNQTGMWNEKILNNYIKEVIINRPETTFYREATLLIIDHYGPHVNLYNSQRLEKYQVFIILVPPTLTSLLQPLDIVLNRSFQAFYSQSYDTYIEKALKDNSMQTKAGNPKMVPYVQLSQWVLDWMETQSKEIVIKAFKVCGIGSKQDFDLHALHEPLKHILLPSFNCDAWIEIYSNVISNPSYFDDNPDSWFWPEDINTSLFRCVWYMCEQPMIFSTWLESYISELIYIIEHDEDLSEIFDDFDKVRLENGETTFSRVEMPAIAMKQKKNIKIVTLDDNNVNIGENLYKFGGISKEVVIANCNGYFGIQI